MTDLAKSGPVTFRWHYLLAGLASIVLSVWTAYAISMPNPDSVLYLSAAGKFAAGHWHDGFAFYKWPAYSLLIAGAMQIGGLDPYIAAQVVNAVLVLGTTLAFIALADELSNGDRAVVTVATILVVFQPQLTEMRPWIIRDHGYLCFFVVAVWLAVADARRPSAWRKLGLLAALAAATLFRIEGFFLALLVAGYYALTRLRTVTAQASAITLFVLATAIGLPFAFGVWVTGSFGKWMAGKGLTVNMTHFGNLLEKRVHVLEDQVLMFGSGLGWQADVAIAIGLALIQIVRALTPVFTAYGLFAFMPNRLIPGRAMLPIVWFTAGQLPMLFLFTFINAMLDWRYAMAFALIAMFTTVYCASVSWRELLMGRPRAFLVFPSLVLAVALTWTLDMPRPQKWGHYREAAQWIRDNVPDDARLWMNETRIAYFSGRELEEIGGVSQLLNLRKPGKPADFDVVVFATRKAGRKLPMPIPPGELALAASFRAGPDDLVNIYAACPAMTACPPAAR